MLWSSVDNRHSVSSGVCSCTWRCSQHTGTARSGACPGWCSCHGDRSLHGIELWICHQPSTRLGAETLFLHRRMGRWGFQVSTTCIKHVKCLEVWFKEQNGLCFRAGHGWWWVPMVATCTGGLFGSLLYELLIEAHHLKTEPADTEHQTTIRTKVDIGKNKMENPVWWEKYVIHIQ